eukprot:8378236-Pyramimonas_sp.AAC.1
MAKINDARKFVAECWHLRLFGLPTATDNPRGSQDRSKERPRDLQDYPMTAQKASKIARMASKAALKRPERAQRRPREAPRTASTEP